MLQSEVIPSLETTRKKIEEHLSTVREYRVFLALEKCISEVRDVGDDIVTTLERVKGKLKERLKEVRAYRALIALEKSIAEIHDILAETSSTSHATQPPPLVPTADMTAQPSVVAPETESASAEGVTLDTARVA